MMAVILAGGFGTRLRPLTNNRPKALLPLMNRPMITYLLDAMPDEVDSVVIAAGYKIDKLRDFFKSNEYPFTITVQEETEPLGTAGGLKNCESFLGDDSELLVFNGDVVSSLDLRAFIDNFRKKNGLGAISLWEVADPSRYGLVDLDGENQILSFTEKPDKIDTRHSFINSGTYIFKREIFDHIPAGRMVSIEREIFPAVLELGLYGYPFSGYWIDAGTAEDYINAHRILFDSPIIFDKNEQENMRDELVKQFPDLKLELPVYSGSGVKIGCTCTLGPNVCLGENVKLGDNVSISNSVVLDNTGIGTGSVLENVIIGYNNRIAENSNLGGYLITEDDFQN